MKKYDSTFFKWFVIFTFPFWAIITIADLRGVRDDWFNTIAGILIVLWILSLIYILCKMLLVRSYREDFLSKIFKQKISDEREMFISGDAAKRTYFFTTSLVLILLFISVFKISFITPSQEERDLGEKGSLSIRFAYSILSKEAIYKDKTEFSIRELPISKEGTLTLMLLLQLISYRMYFRKKLY